MPIISGIVQWAQIYQVNKQFAKDKTGGTYSIELIVDKDNEKVLKKEGLEHLIFEKKDGQRIVKFKRNELSKATGNPNTPPTVVDAKKQPMTKEIGNGSRANISFTTYTGYKSKKYPTLQAVQVEKLVEFDRSSIAKKGSLQEFKEIDTGDQEVHNDDDTPPFELDEAAGDV